MTDKWPAQSYLVRLRLWVKEEQRWQEHLQKKLTSKGKPRKGSPYQRGRKPHYDPNIPRLAALGIPTEHIAKVYQTTEKHVRNVLRRHRDGKTG
jgi:hypothetical protein